MMMKKKIKISNRCIVATFVFIFFLGWLNLINTLIKYRSHSENLMMPILEDESPVSSDVHDGHHKHHGTLNAPLHDRHHKHHGTLNESLRNRHHKHHGTLNEPLHKTAPLPATATLPIPGTTVKKIHTYFWGGGKAGSTSLYCMLTQTRKNSGTNFETKAFNQGGDIGKEPCFGSNGWSKWLNLAKNGNRHENLHILNGCPRHMKRYQAQTLFETGGQDTTFLMLIRDPVDRFVSHVNDDNRRMGRHTDLEVFAQKLTSTRLRGVSGGLYTSLSRQGDMLENLLSKVKDPKKILIIPMESLTVDPQGVIDAVMDHVGGERWKLNPDGGTKLNDGANNKKHKYVTLSNTTRDGLRDVFRSDVHLLERLVGKQFSWSSWAKTNDENARDDPHNDNIQSARNWLVTTPIGLP